MHFWVYYLTTNVWSSWCSFLTFDFLSHNSDFSSHNWIIFFLQLLICKSTDFFSEFRVYISQLARKKTNPWDINSKLRGKILNCEIKSHFYLYLYIFYPVAKRSFHNCHKDYSLRGFHSLSSTPVEKSAGDDGFHFHTLAIWQAWGHYVLITNQ